MIFYYDDRPKQQEMLHNELEFSYRDFKISKRPAYQLYFIVPPKGKVIHKELEGDFSNQRILEQRIDVFLANHPSIDDAYVDAEPPKPKKGRPPKNKTSTQQEEEASLI
jgi:hypothetical protein